MVAGIGGKVVVELPATKRTRGGRPAGQRGSRVCVTAVYASFQALLAASVGASYVAPYLGRMNDAGRDGHELIAQMSEALRSTGSRCEVLAASVRSPEDVARLASKSVRCITISQLWPRSCFAERMTLEATKAFEASAKELNESVGRGGQGFVILFCLVHR